MNFLLKKNINTDYKNRFDLWISFLNEYQPKNVAEIGVYKGEFAEKILRNCYCIENYTMVDAWRNLSDWNKPANTDDNEFDDFYLETINRTKFAEHKIKILRGKTTEVVSLIPDESLDFVYIDGDHTLKGITIDLISLWNKVKPGGFVAGDDFCETIWQHDKIYEPTLVFPFAVYFAEAKNVKIYGLPFNQFLIAKGEKGFEFIDLTNGKYKNVNLLKQLQMYPERKTKNKLFSMFLKGK